MLQKRNLDEDHLLKPNKGIGGFPQLSSSLVNMRDFYVPPGPAGSFPNEGFRVCVLSNLSVHICRWFGGPDEETQVQRDTLATESRNEGQSQDGRNRKEGSCEWGCRPHDILTKGWMPEPERKATLGLLEVSDPCRDGLPPTLAMPEGTTAGLGEAVGR